MPGAALVIPGGRVSLAAGPTVSATAPELEVAFVGYCAGSGPLVQTSMATRELAAAANEAVSALGFSPEPGWYDQPVPVDSSDAFQALFAPVGSVFLSRDTLPGAALWLPAAVIDFFGAGGRRAWIIRVRPGGTPVEAMHVPPIPDGPGLGAAPRGLLAACAVPSVGLVVLPDLERLYAVPEVEMPVPPPVPPPVPGFRPVGSNPAAFRPAVVAPGAGVLPENSLSEILGRLNATLARKRPDVTAILSLPLGPQILDPLPALEHRALQLLYGGSTNDLTQLQAFAPLVADPTGGVMTPSGLIAGAIAAEAERTGPWRSVAGRLLPTAYTPMRRIGEESLPPLSTGGIGVLQQRPGGLELQEELLAVRSSVTSAVAPTRRFIGWLQRQLQSFGLDLVFENGVQDGRVERALSGLFDALFQRGALAGRRLSSAFSVTRLPSSENEAVFQIGFAPAYAIDRITLRFVQTRDGAVRVMPVPLKDAKPATPPYSFLTIDFPGASSTFLSDINDNRQIVGYQRDPSGVLHSLLTDGRTFGAFDPPGFTSTSYPGISRAMGINDSGDIVGIVQNNENAGTRAYIKRSNAFSLYGYPHADPSHGTSLQGINNSGVLVGSFADSTDVPHGIIKIGNDSVLFDDNPNLPANNGTFIFDVNNAGRMVGGYFDRVADAQHGFVMDGNRCTTIDFPGSSVTWLNGINDFGQMVGSYFDDATQAFHGFLTDGNSFSVIDFPGNPGQRLQTFLTGIDNSGQIVGYYGEEIMDSKAGTHGLLAKPLAGGAPT